MDNKKCHDINVDERCLKYTAGRIMTEKVPTPNIKDTVGDIEKMILKNINNYDTINYIYILTDQGLLRGAISIKELYRQSKDTPIRQIMNRDLIMARSGTPQERIVYKALKNNIKAVPVVDKEGKFLGVVQSDNILNTLYTETQKDILKFIGVNFSEKSFEDTMGMSVFHSFKNRFPWLFMGLLGGLFIAKIIGGFEYVLSQNLIIASFIPLIVYMASATGTQMSALITRDLAFDPNFKFFRYFFKQLFVVILISLVISAIFLFINFFVYDQVSLGIVLCVAMFTTMVSSLVTGLMIPYIFNLLKFDPANAGGPVGTIMQDTLSILIYFLVVNMLL